MQSSSLLPNRLQEGAGHGGQGRTGRVLIEGGNAEDTRDQTQINRCTLHAFTYVLEKGSDPRKRLCQEELLEPEGAALAGG